MPQYSVGSFNLDTSNFLLYSRAHYFTDNSDRRSGKANYLFWGLFFFLVSMSVKTDFLGTKHSSEKLLRLAL